MAFTNDYHHLLWSELVINPANNLGLYGHGLYFWIFVSYNYLVLIVGILHLFRALFQFNIIYRSQNILLIIAALSPFVGNFIYVSRLNPIEG